MKKKMQLTGLWVAVLTSMVFPLLLYANNLGQARLTDLWRPLVFSVLFSLLVFLVAYLVLRDMDKAGLVTAVIIFASLSYGHVYTLLRDVAISGVIIGRHRYLGPAFLAICGFLIWLIWSRLENPKNLLKITSSIALILVLVQIAQISYYEISSFIIRKQNASETAVNTVTEVDEKRDVYLIVLDAYTRSDLLRDELEFDNSGFLNQLEEMGFYIVPCSRSNYSYTLQSMTSELNMNYLDDLGLAYDDIVLSNSLKHSEVRRIFDDLGYEFVFYETGYPPTEINDADIFVKASEANIFTDFEVLYLRTTVFGLPYDLFYQHYAQSIGADFNNYANRVKSTFAGLQNPIDSDAPLFVYAHIVSPHSPKLFTRQGGINPNWEADSTSAVDGTYTFIQNQTIKALEEIITNSDQDPIIILQSDHGDTFEGGYRNLNLNAYYLPEGADSQLYPTITPVNTFRLVFSQYFGMDFPLLPDKVYASPQDSRYDFVQVDDPYDNCAVQSSH